MGRGQWQEVGTLAGDSEPRLPEQTQDTKTLDKQLPDQMKGVGLPAVGNQGGIAGADWQGVGVELAGPVRACRGW